MNIILDVTSLKLMIITMWQQKKRAPFGHKICNSISITFDKFSFLIQIEFLDPSTLSALRMGFSLKSESVALKCYLFALTCKATTLHASHLSMSGIQGLWDSSSLKFGVLKLMLPDWPSSACDTLLCPYTLTQAAKITRQCFTFIINHFFEINPCLGVFWLVWGWKRWFSFP